jgi:hypothetical protein
MIKCPKFEYTDEYIEKHRKLIYPYSEKFFKNPTIKNLEKIFQNYNKYFFNNYLIKSSIKVTFKLSGLPTFNTQGYCFRTSCNYTITIPLSILKKIKGPTKIAGILCNDPPDCLLKIMEHELTHLLLFVWCNDTSISDSHGKLFKDTVYKMFRHITTNHEIY